MTGTYLFWIGFCFAVPVTMTWQGRQWRLCTFWILINVITVSVFLWMYKRAGPG